jgi:hypothetical protein
VSSVDNEKANQHSCALKFNNLPGIAAQYICSISGVSCLVVRVKWMQRVAKVPISVARINEELRRAGRLDRK